MADSDTWLELLKSLGVEIEKEVWERVHETAPPEPLPPKLPSRPHHWDGELPVFTSSQLEWCEPELYGYDTYEVVEDEAAAHPLAMEWKDERYYAANGRPIHRYDRPYRIRWTLSHVLGHVGKQPKAVMQWLRDELRGSEHVMTSRAAHEWVRSKLKSRRLRTLYMSTPFLVRQLGGPRWKVTTRQWQRVEEEALYLHRLFENLKRSGLCPRQRFPKIQYVLLRLLDRHGILAPYRIPWARTTIKRRQLAHFLTSLECPSSATSSSGSALPLPSPLPEATSASEHATAQDPTSDPIRSDSAERTHPLQPERPCPACPKDRTHPALPRASSPAPE